MKTISPEHVETFVAACRRVAACGLLRYSSGNMSWRAGGDLMAITAKGSWLGELDATVVAVCEIASGACVNGKTPSVESKFHAGIFQVRPDVNVVLHCQSPYATAIACCDPKSCDFFIIPEVPFYVGHPAVVEYGTPGSEELAGRIIHAMRDHELALLRNHGQVVVGRDFDDVIQKAGFFELACEILLHGADIRPIPAEGIQALLARAAKERKGTV